MASSLPPPEDVRAFRDAVERTVRGGLDPCGPPLDAGHAEMVGDVRTALADFDRAADLAALAAPKPDPDREWQHGSCLAIAEGAPGWDRAFGPEASPAMLAVQKLRAECNGLRGALGIHLNLCPEVEKNADEMAALVEAYAGERQALRAALSHIANDPQATARVSASGDAYAEGVAAGKRVAAERARVALAAWPDTLGTPGAGAALPLADDLAHVVASELTAMQAGAPCDGLRLLAALDAYRKARGA